MTVFEALGDVARHPVEHLVKRWNWKNTVLSVCVRGAIFFTANLADGLPWALRALAVDLAFRIPFVGVDAAITQSLRAAEPAWKASLVLVCALPVGSHVLEALVHWTAGTPELRASILASMSLSIVTTLFSLFAMRRGVFVVGEAARPFRDDIAHLPGLILEFVQLPARAIGRRCEP
jgi:hypothetical protein